MRKIFTITLSILFLLSGVGFGNSQHYCYAAEQTMTPGQMDCCSADPQPQPKMEESSCCELEDSDHPALTASEGFSGGCCVLQQTYKQVDLSPKPSQLDLSQAFQPGNEFHPASIEQKAGERPTLVVPLEPSRFQNTPLLS